MNEKVASSKFSKFAFIGALVVLVLAIAFGTAREFTGSDQPDAIAALARKSAAPSQASAIASLEARTEKDPNDVEAWQLLGWSYFEANRYVEAADAYRKATKLEPQRAVYWSSLGESLVMASEQDPMPPEAAQAFDKAVALDPKDPRSRYFLAVRKDLSGDHAGAIGDWTALLKDTPQGAPWEADLVRTIEQVGQINKIDVAKQIADAKRGRISQLAMATAGSVAAAPIPGPTKADMAQAAKLPPGQQQQMVSSMVEGLETKLAQNPGNVSGWIMLMRSRMTLGETVKASTALKKAIAANPTESARLAKEAQLLGVPGG